MQFSMLPWCSDVMVYCGYILCCQWPAAGSCFVCWFNRTQMCACVFICLEANMRDEWATSCPTWKNLAHRRDRDWLAVCSELGEPVNYCSMCVQADCRWQHTAWTDVQKDTEQSHTAVNDLHVRSICPTHPTSLFSDVLLFLCFLFIFCCSNTTLQCPTTSCSSLI